MRETVFCVLYILIFSFILFSCAPSDITDESEEPSKGGASFEESEIYTEISVGKDTDETREESAAPSDEESKETSEGSYEESAEGSSEEVPEGFVYAYSEDDVVSFVSDKANAGKTLLFKNDITLSGAMEAAFPFILDTDGHACLAEKLVSFVTEDEGTIIVSSPEVIANIYAPNCDVIITGDAFGFEYAEKYFAFASYNGVPCPASLCFGGETPEKITLCGNDGVIDGNCVYFSYPFMQNFSVTTDSLTFEGENVTDGVITSEDGAFYAVFTDKENKKRGYRIIAERQNNILPVVYIDIEDGKTVVSKEEYLGCTVTVDYNGYAGSEDFDEINALPAGVRGRGHSSWELDKKPYKLKFEEKASLFGLTKAKKWVLQANHTDRTLFRNTLAMRMGSILDNMLFVPHSYPVDLFVNGEYAGVYTLTEQIEIHKGRIEGEEDSTETDTDFLIEMGEDAAKTSFGYNVFHSSLELFMAIKNPSEDVLTQDQFDYVKDYFDKADEAVKNKTGYEEFIDVDSLIDWFILDEFSYNLDCTFRRSGIYLKQKNGKIFLASPWDFDCAFGNFSLDNYEYTGWISLGNSKTDNYDEYIKTNWMDFLLEDDEFKAKLKARWDEVGDKLYETAKETISTLSAEIAPSAKYNFTVWNKVFGEKLQYESVKSRTLMTYEEQIEYLEWFIDTRYEWINEEISKY